MVSRLGLPWNNNDPYSSHRHMQTVTAIMPPDPSPNILPTLHPPAHQFTCRLPVVPPPVLTPPPFTASNSATRLKPDNPELKLPSPSRGGRGQRSAHDYATHQQFSGRENDDERETKNHSNAKPLRRTNGEEC